MRRRPFLLQIAHTQSQEENPFAPMCDRVSRLLLYTLQSVGKYHFLGGNFFTLLVSTFRGILLAFLLFYWYKKAAKTTMSNIPR